MKRKIFIFFVAISCLFLTNCKNATKSNHPKMTVVKFGMLPYADHTYPIIGVEKGWFKDVGIKLNYSVIKIEQVIPFLENGNYDVISTPPGILFAAYDNDKKDLVSFVFGDLFQGYAVMAQPHKGYVSVSSLVDSGYTEKEALYKTCNQIKGKVFTYSSEPAIKPFINLVLEKGKIGKSNYTPLILDDPLTVSAMRSGKADFQVGGVPSRITLQKEGFIPIVSSVDLAKGAKPSAKSKELASILQNGWATTKHYYKQRFNVILRLASVNFRIMKFMKTNEKEAIKIHMRYLTTVTGDKFDSIDGKIIYNNLDPFYTFKEQYKWFYDTTSNFYYKYVNGSIINSYIKQGVYKNAPPTVEDVIYANDVYGALLNYKLRCDSIYPIVQNKYGIDNKLIKKSEYFYKIYDYLDAYNYLLKLMSE